MADEIIALKVDTTPFSELSIMGNLAELQRLCDEKASEFNISASIEDGAGYKKAKSRLAYWRKAMKQVEAERKRVKTAYVAPLTTFEAGVKHASASLAEVIDKQDSVIKAFEAGKRDEKRDRLRAYWEDTYPVYALDMGEAKGALVPFERVFDPDWVKRMSEVMDDGPACDAMDGIAETLAKGEAAIEELEPEARTFALSELYRTLDLSAAITGAREEMRRRADIERYQAAQRDAGPTIAPVEPEPEQVPESEPEAREEPQGARYVITIECAGADEKNYVVSIMKTAGIHGHVKAFR